PSSTSTIVNPPPPPQPVPRLNNAVASPVNGQQPIRQAIFRCKAIGVGRQCRCSGCHISRTLVLRDEIGTYVYAQQQRRLPRLDAVCRALSEGARAHRDPAEGG